MEIRTVGVSEFCYGGLELAFTAGWSWRIPMVGRVGALRRFEFGVYGELELAYLAGWLCWALRRVGLGVYDELELAYTAGWLCGSFTPG